jgi:photosystem II stability/assembly factor-like uncharacterized protein
MGDASNGVAVGSNGVLVFTTNGGVDWTDATTTNVDSTYMWGVSMGDASNGVAVGSLGQIVYTTNGGVDWTDATTTNVGETALAGVSMSDASNGVAVGSNGVLVFTTNGGVDWTDATTTNVGATYMRGVSMSDANNGVAVGASGKIIFTTNGGVDWTAATTTDVGATHMYGVSMSDASNGVAVGLSGTIVYTTNGGVDWTDATTTNVGATYMYGVSMGDASNGVAVGKLGEIVFTGSAPSEVGTVSTTTGNTQVELSWSAPSDNGSAITDYIIQYSTDDSNWSTFADGTSTGTTATVTGLTNGTLYYFQVAAVNANGTGTYPDSVSDTPSTAPSKNKCYDCEPPKLTKVEIHISSSPFDYVWNFDQDNPLAMLSNTITPITANPGDEIEITLDVIDDKSVHLLPTSGIYTNFMERPNDMNLFFVNNFDENHNTSTSFYEWNRNHDDVAYDYADSVTWSSPDISYTQFPVTAQTPFELLNDELVIEHFIISFKMKFDDPMRPSQVWVSAADYYGQTFKVPLPLTLEILGDEPIDFTSTLNQEVLGYFNEPVLLSMLNEWNQSSQDVSELSSILGVNDELPQWVVPLAIWTAEGKITPAEMIIAIEILINQYSE